MLNAVEHMNFFEGRATEYSKASTKGTWVEAFSKIDWILNSKNIGAKQD